MHTSHTIHSTQIASFGRDFSTAISGPNWFTLTLERQSKEKMQIYTIFSHWIPMKNNYIVKYIVTSVTPPTRTFKQRIKTNSLLSNKHQCIIGLCFISLYLSPPTHVWAQTRNIHQLIITTSGPDPPHSRIQTPPARCLIEARSDGLWLQETPRGNDHVLRRLECHFGLFIWTGKRFG